MSSSKTMHSTNFGSTFAPYTPPPDDPALVKPASPSTSAFPRAPGRPAWFPASSSDAQSYQAGGLPTLGTAYGGGGGVGVGLNGISSAVGGPGGDDAGINQWETRYGMRVDVLAAFAYLLGPVSALICLVLETHNDYVRFHAYQSALVTTPLVLLRIFGSLVGLPSFLNTLVTLWIIITQGFMAFRAYIDAAQNNLTRFYLPYVGPMADQWVAEE